MWYCGGALVGGGILLPDHRQNQTRMRLSAQSDISTAIVRGDFTAKYWRKAKTLLQFSEILANISELSLMLLSLLLFAPFPCRRSCYKGVGKYIL